MNIDITLGGKTASLNANLAAAKAVNALGTGFQNAIFKIGALDLDTYAGVVAAGLGKKASEVEDAVFQSGLVNLTAPLVEFVTLLANGGKPLNNGEPAA
ncbi:hypothetical protein [Bradyrhizobium ottawaense]